MILMFAAALAAMSAPGAAVTCAEENSVPALVCRALAAQGQGQPDAAAERFEAAAQLAGASNPERDRLLAAAGNMWIAAGQYGKAAQALDRAIAGKGLQSEQRGEALLDRARAAEAQGQLTVARAKVTQAAQTVSADPFLWYFSAALAIREGDKATAKSSIDRAMALAPGDPTMLFEAGHVAHFSGDVEAARGYWTRAAAADPNGASGKAARDALRLLPVGLSVKSAAGATK